jgi:hypothetical protein
MNTAPKNRGSSPGPRGIMLLLVAGFLATAIQGSRGAQTPTLS